MTITTGYALLAIGAMMLLVFPRAVAGATVSSKTALKEPVFVIVPHADDWQIFAGDQIAKLIKEGNSVSIIQLTGYGGECWERAHLATVLTAIKGKLVILSCDNSSSVAPMKCQVITVNTHSMRLCSYKNVKVYFMGLPNTLCPTCGNGYAGPHNDHRTLIELYRGRSGPLTAFGGASYNSFKDLTSTVHQIIESNISPERRAQFFSFTPMGFAKGDHFDHSLAACVLEGIPEVLHINVFTGYDNAALSENLTPEQLKMKETLFVSSFGGTLAPVPGNGLGDPNGAQYQTWIRRTYVESLFTYTEFTPLVGPRERWHLNHCGRLIH